MDKFKVEIINKEEAKELFKHWGITSCICYATPEKFAEKVGKSCLETSHFSGSRGRYIEFKIEEAPRAALDEMFRHEQGVFKNMESGRYVDFSDFNYYTSPLINSKPHIKKIYDDHMELTKKTYKEIVRLLKEDGITGERAYQEARGIAPMNYSTKCVIGFTVEALINLCNKRLCVCSQDHIRKLVKIMRDLVVDIIPELDEYLVAACDYNLYCGESKKRSCGRHLHKSEVKLILEEYKRNKKEINII